MQGCLNRVLRGMGGTVRFNQLSGDRMTFLIHRGERKMQSGPFAFIWAHAKVHAKRSFCAQPEDACVRVQTRAECDQFVTNCCQMASVFVVSGPLKQRKTHGVLCLG